MDIDRWSPRFSVFENVHIASGSLKAVLQLGLCCLFVSGAIAAEQTPPRPNIVLILADDLGYADVGFHGSTEIKTPHLDRLANGGTIFSSAYVAHPFCGPSRMGLLTGRYPYEFGAPFNLPDNSTRRYTDQGIPPDETLISSVLQSAGYRTGIMGKWHLGQQPEHHPNQRGFDDFFGFLGGGILYFGPYKANNKAGNVWDYKRFPQHNGADVTTLTEKDYMTDVLSREGVRFVRGSAGTDKPFFLFMSYNAPHTVLAAKEEDLALFPNLSGKRQTYAAMVYALDRGVGELVSALKETGQYENTLIVFLSDNGGRTDQGASNLPLRGGKGDTTEGGYRTPMFFHWPNVVRAGERYAHPVTALDFYPTFAGLAGAIIPEGKDLDGKDIWDAVQAGISARDGEMIYTVRHRNGSSDVGARRDEWKLCRAEETWKLFNVEQDLAESHDLSNRYPEIMRQMQADVQHLCESHTEPLWFDTDEQAAEWRTTGMPQFGFVSKNTERTTSASETPPQTVVVTDTAAALPGPVGNVFTEHPGDWRLVPSHSDEFNAAAVDTSKWNIDPEDWGVWSWEPENVTQEHGSLHLTIDQNTHTRGKQELYYVSGMAKNERTITYGYFEARVKGCSRYPGACPAFWLYSRGPTNRFQARDGETVSYSEIDIVELQQSEWDFESKQHFPVTHMDCNLHAVLQRDGQDHWVRPHSDPEMCKTAYDASWDPREDYHVYAVLNTREEIVWYIDGKEVGRKPNLYWHLPMHLTLSLGLRHPFVKYQDGKMVSVPEAKTDEGFPTSMAVDYVRVWQRPEDAKLSTATDWTLSEYVARERVKWEQNGWPWNQDRVETNFHEIDTNNDGLASGKERQEWFQKKGEESK